MKIEIAVYTAQEGYSWQPETRLTQDELAEFKACIGRFPVPSAPDFPFGGIFLKGDKVVFYRYHVARKIDFCGRDALYCVLGVVPKAQAARVVPAALFALPAFAAPMTPFPSDAELDEASPEAVPEWLVRLDGMKLDVRIGGPADKPSYVVNYVPDIPPDPPAETMSEVAQATVCAAVPAAPAAPAAPSALGDAPAAAEGKPPAPASAGANPSGPALGDAPAAAEGKPPAPAAGANPSGPAQGAPARRSASDGAARPGWVQKVTRWLAASPRNAILGALSATVVLALMTFTGLVLCLWWKNHQAERKPAWAAAPAAAAEASPVSSAAATNVAPAAAAEASPVSSAAATNVAPAAAEAKAP